MCGFVGQFLNENFNYKILNKMSETLIKRGPDDSGHYIDKENKIAFFHRRLSILDLSKAGSQPMKSFSDRFIIAFNGEIYNHLDIRNKLKSNSNIEWKSSSDTETLLTSFEILGIKETINLCEGMFSIAIWDNKIKKLFLVRDKIGEKPLYYGFNNNIFYFGSDLKAFKADPNFISQLDEDSIRLYFKLNYIPSPNSIYKHIYKLTKASILSIDNTREIIIEKYWSAKKFDNKSISYDEYLNMAEKKIENAVIQQTISDRPVGSFLSSGTDSSLVSYFMQKNSLNKLKTFTIGFKESSYDESVEATKIANFLGTDHYNIVLNNNNYLDALNNQTSAFSEPFSDSSQLVTYMISKEAKKHVDVILSGDGGDEGFLGYNRYFLINKFITFNKIIPFEIRKILSSAIGKISLNRLDNFNNLLKKNINSKFLINNLSSRLGKIQNSLKSDSLNDLYISLITNDNNSLFNKEFIKHDLITNFLNLDLKSLQDLIEKDIEYYLSDDIMCKVDRSAMENSLETRMPLASANLLQFAKNIPLKYRMKNGEPKHILKNILYKNVPKKLFSDSKKGFEIPLGKLLKTTFLDWCEDTFNNGEIKNFDFLNTDEILQIWEKHKKGIGNYQYQLWNILMFLSWAHNK